MAIQRKLKNIQGLDSVEALLDGLTDAKFRERALRNAGRKAMEPVKETLKSKIPVGSSPKSSYRHYQGSSRKQGYTSGDLREGVKLRVNVNTRKKIKVGKGGRVKDNQASELFANVTFDNHVYGLAAILENGRQKRVAKTKNGKVFHAWGKPTDSTHRDIGTTEPKHFVSETYAEHESAIVERFKGELINSIEKQAKAMRKANARK
ncbi:hypothetical protein BA746_00345 [Vibrio parahaemolyticus]|uniref:hypothetical protein n=1 Tax=Vibrio parahaemolyticus TaxID=670 RepID=UPI0006A5F0BC|nr:hypothetical protein [Vibrio parahaemolyticus]KOF30951.1 hypothetical protein ACX04_15950 [Vibrio parahaemolyticus]OTW07818.1 hypothetical protein BA743_16340 [Vibrio parahaemolyticus]OTW23947.1 hypothetical protein BA744_01035 [Vibrio parahaemolyticus]OTW27243.1 hypothetical protein BA746_00345 [Vibrio parahaemolyticus]